MRLVLRHHYTTLNCVPKNQARRAAPRAHHQARHRLREFLAQYHRVAAQQFQALRGERGGEAAIADAQGQDRAEQREPGDEPEAADVAAQMAAGDNHIFGVMVESHLCAGAQKFTPGKDDPAKLAYGQSITDACIGWDDSEQVLQILSDAVKARRAR